MTLKWHSTVAAKGSIAYGVFMGCKWMMSNFFCLTKESALNKQQYSSLSADRYDACRSVQGVGIFVFSTEASFAGYHYGWQDLQAVG